MAHEVEDVRIVKLAGGKMALQGRTKADKALTMIMPDALLNKLISLILQSAAPAAKEAHHGCPLIRIGSVPDAALTIMQCEWGPIELQIGLDAATAARVSQDLQRAAASLAPSSPRAN